MCQNNTAIVVDGNRKYAVSPIGYHDVSDYVVSQKKQIPVPIHKLCNFPKGFEIMDCVLE